ncbi:hypothetical protein [Hymenobacter sp. AT01-02]|uniref:hypothetical protein n=1 Tax=Hymenobacter sp. AT01-02 TaxID=1571877 RepID=UPI000A4E1382|nr:hypothetical protein [Hymenobacter sp. AT01-02]
MNPRGLQLATGTVLYRQLRDTLGGRPALRIQAGDAVIIRQEHPRWIKVMRGTRSLINFSSDTTTYYMPASGALGAKTFIII